MEKELELFLHASMPLTIAMGITVLEATPQRVRLFAPFVNNKNHKETVFGGSLNALTTLACWTLLYVRLKNIKGIDNQLVITRSEVDYLAPVEDDFVAQCEFNDPVSWERFVKMLKTKGKGRIQLQSTIQSKGNLCVNFKGTFAAVPLEKSGELCNKAAI